MFTLAIARLHDIRMGPDIVAYLEKVDASFSAYCGHFLVHGAPSEQIEGSWTGDLVIVEFPDRATAHAWYESEAYQGILRLRTDNATCDVIMIDTVPPGYRATEVLKPPARIPAAACAESA